MCQCVVGNLNTPNEIPNPPNFSLVTCLYTNERRSTDAELRRRSKRIGRSFSLQPLCSLGLRYYVCQSHGQTEGFFTSSRARSVSAVLRSTRALAGVDRTRQDLIEQAKLEDNHHVLDIGCGTGTLVLQLKRQFPTVQVVGVDPDPKALGRAKAKAKRAGVSIKFEQGFADELPYESGSFDRVFSSFMFHHLDEADREKALREAFRVLKPGGSFHLLDFIGDDHGSHGFFHRLVNSHAEVRQNTDERLLQAMVRAGFREAKKVRGARMFLGLLQTGEYEGGK